MFDILTTLSDFIDCYIGLMQRETCSPLLFAFFISDIENSLQENEDAGITLHQLSLNIMINLFDSYVCSISNYASEIWGLTSAMRIDRVQRKFCKWTLNVKQFTNNLAVCSELEIYPVRIVKYWLKLISNEFDNIILYTDQYSL